MKVFVQKIDGDVMPNSAVAVWGFRKKGYEVEYFDAPSIPENDGNIVVGGIPVIDEVLSKMGLSPQLENTPETLTSFLGRKVWYGTMNEARNNYPVFVKPIEREWKRFNGYVINTFQDLIKTAHIPGDHRVILSEPVSFLSEYRIFILKGEILGCSNYSGDFRILLDFNVVDLAIKQFKDAPAAYSLDFGVDEKGRTLLVEANDALALGCYGLNPLYYATMIEKRWEELNSQK